MVRPRDDLKSGIRRLEEHLQGMRAVAAGADFPSQLELYRFLNELSGIYWSKQISSSDRAFLRSTYLSALETIKLVADDAFIEALAAIKADTPRKRAAKEDEVHERYLATLHDWIRASPVIERKLAAVLSVSPPARRGVGIPWLLGGLGKSLGAAPTKPIGTLTDRVENTLKRAVESARKDAARTKKPFALRLSSEWRHQVGLVFMLLQLRLSEQSWRLSPISSPNDLSSWYSVAEWAVDWMNEHVLDLLCAREREALVSRRTDEFPVYGAEGNRLLDLLATTYSIRGRFAAMLWTFIHSGTTKDARVLKRSVTDSDGVTELITALPGRPNPDDQDNVGAQSVEELLATATDTLGTSIKVYGLKKTGKTRLFTLHSIASSAKVEVRFAGKAFPGAYARYVVVEGVLKQNGTTFVIEATDVDEFRVPYISLTGISQLFAQGGNPPLRREPRWRTPTDATSRFAIAELEDERIPEILAGRNRLVADLLHWEEIRTGFATTLKSDPNLDLHDRGTRVRAWQITLRKFLKQFPTVAMSEWIGLLIQRYLTHYTRHTFWNIRDKGKNYLETTWPKDVAGQGLHDCGVYALETAYDIFQTVQAVSGAPAVEFELLITADHATLIGFFDKKWFMVNNRRIDRPKSLPRDAAISQAVGVGYRRVHNLQFNVLPYIKSAKAITTNQSDAAFRTAIWNDYLALGGWGVAAPVGDQYYRAMRAFDHESRQLLTSLESPTFSESPASSDMLKATRAAKRLFDLAEVLVNKDLIFGRGYGKQGIVFTETPKLPMYQVADKLTAAAKAKLTLSTEQGDLVSRAPDHPKHLLDLWLKGAKALAGP